MSGLKRRITLILCLFAVIMALPSLTAFNWVSAEEVRENQPYVIKSGEFDEYTNSDKLYNPDTGIEEEFSVYNYAEHLAEIYPYNNQSLIEDTWLLKTIPECLFQNKGEYLYLGEKYSFYLNYEESEDRYFYYLLKTIWETKLTNPDLLDGQVKFSLSPIAYNYCRYDETTRKILPVTTSYYEEVSGVTIVSSNRMRIKRVYIKDVSFVAQLNNKYHINQWQEGYSAYDDNGQFFIGTDYLLSGSSLPNSTQYDIEGAKLLLGAICAPFPALGPIVEAGLTVWDLLDTTYSALIASEEDFTDDCKIGDANTFQMNEISKGSQINEYGQLKKIAASGIQTSNTQPIVLRTYFNHYAGTSFYINETDIWEAILEIGVSLDIVEDFEDITATTVSRVNEIATAVKSTTFSISTRENEEASQALVENTTQTFYSITNGTAKFHFLAQRNGEYSLNYSNADDSLANIKIFNRDGQQLYSFSNVEGGTIYRLQLIENERYIIEITNVSLEKYSKYNVSLEFSPPELCLGENTVVYEGNGYYKFVSSDIAYYDFVVGEEAEIELYHKDYTPFNYSNYINLVLGENQIVFIKVNFSSPEAILTISKSKRINYNYSELEAQTLRYGQEFSLQVVERNGYIFEGWYIDNENELITVADLWEYPSSDIYLYPSWSLEEYIVSFNENGGSLVEDIVYTVETPLFELYDSSEISREDYTFIGWLDENGDVITYIESGTVGNVELNAKWVETIQQITLDVNSAITGGVNATIPTLQVDVVYNQTFTLPIPQIQGYVFNGWFDGNVQYTYADGTSLSTYLGESDIVLTASWSVKSFTIKVLINENINGQTQAVEYWIAEGGQISDTETQVGYFTTLCPHCVIRDSFASGRFNEPGKIFNDLVGVGIDGCWVQAFPALENGAEIELAPTFTTEVYTVDFDDFSQSELPAMQIEYGSEYDLPTLSFTGYTVNGWIVTDCFGNEIFNGTAFEIGSSFASSAIMPDLSVGTEGNVTIYLSVSKTGNIYNVTLKTEDGTTVNTYQAVYGDVLSGIQAVQKVGHRFEGWYNGDVKTINADGFSCDAYGVVQPWSIAEDIALTALHSPNAYTITYNYNLPVVTVTYGQVVTLHNPCTVGYDEYWKIQGTDTIVGAAGSQIVYNFTESIVLEIYQVAKTYLIKYISDISGVYYPKYKYVFGEVVNLGQADSRLSQNVFGGFYLNSSYTNRIYSISKDNIVGDDPIVNPAGGDIILYVKWDSLFITNYFRDSALTINDGSTECDSISISLDAINYEMKYGYLHVAINFVISEKYDGYQHVKICCDDREIIPMKKIQHKPGSKDANAKTYTWELWISTSSIENGQFLEIKYDASGNGNNTWYCHSVDVECKLTHNFGNNVYGGV